MASPSTTINANLKINQPSVKSAQRTVQSAFNNINLNPKSVSQFSNSLGRITGQATEFKKSMDAATARVFAFGATATVINGISQSFKALVTSTIDVEKRLIEINSIFGATEKQFAAFRKSIFEVAKNTGQSFAVVADGAAELARQGLSAEETAKRLNASLILTRVSGLDAVSSVNSLTAALNGFKSAGLEAETIVNKIIAVDTAFAVSAKDLAEGFQRAGSTAEDAGVSFDELLGLITAVQQKTARGGAVIGNAFKSIFTRLSRGTTISELQELGVQIDASQSGVQKLNALSTALENVADPNAASKIKELAGGVFQINVVSAALKDLSSETSIFADAASKSANASNEAFTKNEALNKSLAAQINALVVGTTNLAEKLGQLTLGPIIGDLTSLASKLTGFFDNALSEDSGNNLIKGFFQGIAAFIQGPGIVLVTGAFLNIFKIVARFAKEGFQDLLKIGSGQEKIKSIEAGIVQLLSQDATLRKQLVSTTLTQAQKEQLVIQAIQRENALLREQQAILAGLAASAARAGVTGFGAGRGFSGKKGRGFASGFTPIEGAIEVAEARSLGARGAVRPRLSQGTIGGRKFIMNSQETEIPNFGRNGDSAVIPNYANGFVPNFNRKRRGATSNRAKVDGSTSVEEFEKLSNTQLKAFSNFPNARTALANKKAGKTPIGSKEKRVNINASPFGFLVPKIGFSQTLNQGGSFDTPKGKIFYNMSGVNVKGPRLPENVDKVDDPETANLQKAVQKSVLQKSTNFARALIDPANSPSQSKVEQRLLSQKGGKGAIEAAVGAAFEAAVSTALGVDEVKIKSTQGDFDLRATKGKGINPDLFKLFNSKRFTLGEFKASASRSNLNSFAKKIIKNKTKGSFNLTKASYAKGFIPNFANPLGEAISRETSGTGISKSQIRISNDKRLANKSNPLGLAVTNTRDEPNGLKDVFAKGFIPNFQTGEQSKSGLDKGLTASLVFSLLIPQITTLGEKGNTAAKKVEGLTKQKEKLEEQLENVNQKTNPEKFKSLSEELSKVSQAQEKAIESSESYSNTLNNTLAILNTSTLVVGQLGDSLKKLAAINVGSSLVGRQGFGAVGGKIKGSLGGAAAAARTFGPAAIAVAAALAVRQMTIKQSAAGFDRFDERSSRRQGLLTADDLSGKQFEDEVDQLIAETINPINKLGLSISKALSNTRTADGLSNLTKRFAEANPVLDEEAFSAKVQQARAKLTQEVSGLVNVFDVAANTLPDSTIKFQSELDRFKEAIAVGGKDFNLRLKKAFIDNDILNFDFGIDKTPAQRRREAIDKANRSAGVSRELLVSQTGRDVQGVRQQLEASRKAQLSNLANLEGFEELGISIKDFATRDITALRAEFNNRVKEIRSDRNLLERIGSVGGSVDAPADVKQAKRLLDNEAGINTIFTEADRINKQSQATASTLDRIGADLQTSLKTDDADLFNEAIESFKALEGIDAEDVFKAVSKNFVSASKIEEEKRLKIVQAIDDAGQKEIDIRKNLFDKLKANFNQTLKNFESLDSPSAIDAAFSVDSSRSEKNEALDALGISQEGRANAVLASTSGDFVNAVLRGAGTEITELLDTLGTATLTKGQQSLFDEVNQRFTGSGIEARGLAGAGTDGGRVLTVDGARQIEQLLESRQQLTSADDIRARLQELGSAGRAVAGLSPANEQQRRLQQEVGLDIAGEIEQLEEALKLVLSTATEDQMLVQLEAIATNTSLLVRQFENAIVDSLRGGIAVDSAEGRALAATFEPQAQADENKVREDNNEKLAQINQKEQENREKIAAEEAKIATSLANVSSALESAASRISGEGSLDTTPNIV